MRDNYFTKSQLLERRWTLAAIKKYLGEADLTKPNPHYRRNMMRLYLRSRVEAAEQTPEFIIWLTASAARRSAASIKAKSRAKIAEANLVNSARAIADAIVIPIMKPEHLKHAAMVKCPRPFWTGYAANAARYSRGAR